MFTDSQKMRCAFLGRSMGQSSAKVGERRTVASYELERRCTAKARVAADQGGMGCYPLERSAKVGYKALLFAAELRIN